MCNWQIECLRDTATHNFLLMKMKKILEISSLRETWNDLELGVESSKGEWNVKKGVGSASLMEGWRSKNWKTGEEEGQEGGCWRHCRVLLHHRFKPPSLVLLPRSRFSFERRRKLSVTWLIGKNIFPRPETKGDGKLSRRNRRIPQFVVSHDFCFSFHRSTVDIWFPCRGSFSVVNDFSEFESFHRSCIPHETFVNKMISDEIAALLRIDGETAECSYLTDEWCINWTRVDSLLSDSGELALR